MEISTADINHGPEVSRSWFGWEQSILEHGVETLLEAVPEGSYDFSSLAVICPTREAGRKLHESLTLHAHHAGHALLAPQIMMPEGVLAWVEPMALSEATEIDSLLAWVEVLENVDLATVPQVLPRPPATRDFAWALAMAVTFRRLLHTLGEAGWSMAQATARLGATFPEAERWAQLSLLEQHYTAQLTRAGLVDRNRALARAALAVQPSADVRKLIVLGVPEPLPLVRTAWERLARQGLPVQICVQAPDYLAATFDLWGQPRVEHWSQRPLPITQPAEQILVRDDPAALAAELVTLTETTPGELAIGMVDREVLPLALAKYAERDIATFNPEGEPLTAQSLYWMLTGWQELLAARSWSAWAQWLRVPEVLGTLVAEIVWPEDQAAAPETELLRAADACAAAHLPSNLADARGAMQRAGAADTPLAQALRITSQWLDDFVNQDFPIALTDFLERLYGPVQWPAGEPKTIAFTQASEHVVAKLSELSRAAAALPRRLEPAQLLTLLLRVLREVRLFPEAASGGVELSGWLELSYATAEHLVIVGVNDGLVPTAITADSWLPHGLRATLNLRTNEERLAVDAFRLAALLEQRATTGSVRLLVGRASTAGEALKPSRLLLLCPPQSLPARVQMLFAEAPPAPVAVAEWQRAWQLTPRFPADWKLTKVSATTFAKYLMCPFRYYLEMVLRMEDYDAQKQEMNAMDFGNLCHYAFECLALDPLLKHETDVARVAAYLKEKTAERVAQLYGSHLSVPLLVQRTSVQQRLAAAAPILVQSRLEGWEIQRVEVDLRDVLGAPWLIEGIEISGRIDMVEYHPQLEKWRIIDYKTSAKPVSPADGHLRPAPRSQPRPVQPYEEGFAEAALLPDGRRWKNLQLPLYAAALQRHYGQPVEAAYFNLPPATTQVQLATWTEMNAEHLPEHAVACATAVIQCLKDGQFWPPNPQPEYPNFDRLFIDGDVEASVDPTLLLADLAKWRTR